jgi:hypothetical protein
MRNTDEVMLATVVFRLLNRISVGEAIWNQADIEYESAWAQYMETGKVAVLKRAILANCGNGPYVTGAYIISSPPGMNKLDGMLKIIDTFNKKSGWQVEANYMSKMDGHSSLEIAWDWFKRNDYFGPFHSYEIVTDLRHTTLLGGAPDILTWANPGPGARRGLNRVHERKVKDHTVGRDGLIEEMRALLEISRDARMWPHADTASCGDGSFDERHRREIENKWPAWEMREVEHTLCEFDKYERVRLGEGKPRGVYR